MEGLGITSMALSTKCDIPGIDQSTFETIANGAKENCPVSKALAGTDITLKAELVSN
jgi:osmotically inducible protein OsmC